MLLYDERNLKAPAARLQCAEDAFVLDLQWRPSPQAPPERAASAAGVTSAAAANSRGQLQQQQRQQNVESSSRPRSRQTSPTKSSSSQSRFGNENAETQPGGDVSHKPSATHQTRPTVQVPATAADRQPQQAALGSPPRSPRATLRQLLDGGSPVRDPAAVAAAAAETQRQVHACAV